MSGCIRGGIVYRMTARTSLPMLLGFAGCLCMATLRAAEPQAAGPDWVYYATVEPGGAKQDLFFLRSDIKTTPDGHVKVWTKGLSDYRLARVKLTEDQIRRAAERIVATPSTLPGITADQQTAIAAYEVLADDGKLDPKARILWELDCSNELMRSLSMYLTGGGKHLDSNVTGEWMHSPPESTISMLMTMVCAARK